MKKFCWLVVLSFVLLTSLACRLTGGGNAAQNISEEEMRSTVAVMQQTIDASRDEAEETAQAWMTEMAPEAENSAGGAGTAVPSGAISGALSYPSESIPALRLVAFNTTNGGFVALEVAAGTSIYRMDNVPPGSYTLAAYPLEDAANTTLSGGYTEAVPCGLQVSCMDHGLIIFEVRAGEETMGIDPGDWYAPAGTFPPDPTR